MYKQFLSKYNLNTSPQLFSDRTRDSNNYPVFIDKVSGVIWCDIENTNYDHGAEYWGADFLSEARAATIVDDARRVKQFSKYFTCKSILDFGCGHGGFLKLVDKTASHACGFDEQYLGDDYEKFSFWDIGNDHVLFDCVTMFHVLEHLVDPVGVLEAIKSHLHRRGKIIIEVPHANDWLIHNCEEFKMFTLWSEHKVLHTKQSLYDVLRESGFKNIEVSGYQRYGLGNHLHWLSKKKGGGIDAMKEFNSCEYLKILQNLGMTDTLVAIAEAY